MQDVLGGGPLALEERPLMTIREAAVMLNVHLSTLRRWEKAGWLVSMRVGPRGHRRYSRESILKLAGKP